MSSYYPEGGMMGSGIYAQEIEKVLFCENCDKDVDVLLTTDDWGFDAYGECECGEEFHLELGGE